MEMSATASGIQSFLNAKERIQDSATQIARSVVDGSPGDLIEPLIDLKVAEQQAGAAAKIIEVENKQVGTLLDLLA